MAHVAESRLALQAWPTPGETLLSTRVSCHFSKWKRDSHDYTGAYLFGDPLPLRERTGDELDERLPHGLHMLPGVRLMRLPRMADFALWATACESAFRPAGTLETAYSNNRRAATENIIDADPVAALVREIMADRAQWRGGPTRRKSSCSSTCGVNETP